MAISTLNIDTTPAENSGTSINRSLSPGNEYCKINRIWMEKSRFVDNKTGAEQWLLIMNLEGPAQHEGFEGFFIDQNNQALGRCKGQSANVKTRMFSYGDFTDKEGTLIPRDRNLLIDLKLLCEALNILPWFNSAPQQTHNTVEDLVAAMNREQPFKDIWMHYCLAGKGFKNKAGFDAWELYLPLPGALGKPYHKDVTKVQKFFELEHTKKSVPKAVTAPVAQTPLVNSNTVPPPEVVKTLSQAERSKIAQDAIAAAEKKVAATIVSTTPHTDALFGGEPDDLDFNLEEESGLPF